MMTPDRKLEGHPNESGNRKKRRRNGILFVTTVFPSQPVHIHLTIRLLHHPDGQSQREISHLPASKTSMKSTGRRGDTVLDMVRDAL